MRRARDAVNQPLTLDIAVNELSVIQRVPHAGHQGGRDAADHAHVSCQGDLHLAGTAAQVLPCDCQQGGLHSRHQVGADGADQRCQICSVAKSKLVDLPSNIQPHVVVLGLELSVGGSLKHYGALGNALQRRDHHLGGLTRVEGFLEGDGHQRRIVLWKHATGDGDEGSTPNRPGGGRDAAHTQGANNKVWCEVAGVLSQPLVLHG
mmetsp:Transcript_1634/g.4712  ORF Transcript_1634/g.4712 Transcript_1634/m.4712 type:complete len:206 (+) Transcript_1634:1127-1744(+)